MEPAVLGEYYTVAGTGTAEIVDRRSRFLGAVAPAADEQEAQAFLAEICREHWEARHHVYAYVVEGGRIRRCSDDGEPQGTGGKPVLDVVQGAELMQCVAVVTRYFGGILLGTGGLVRAYSHAAARAVEAAGRVCMKPCVLMETVCDYAQYGRRLPYIAASGGTVEDTVFAEGVSLRFRLPEDESARFEKGLADLTAGTVSARVTGYRHVAYPADPAGK